MPPSGLDKTVILPNFTILTTDSGISPRANFSATWKSNVRMSLHKSGGSVVIPDGPAATPRRADLNLRDNTEHPIQNLDQERD